MKHWSSPRWDGPGPEITETLFSIIRVCHYWHDIGMHRLYSHLHLSKTTFEHIEHISDVIERQGYGEYVKRVDVRFDLLSSRWDVLPLLRLLNAVSDLRVLTFIPPWDSADFANWYINIDVVAVFAAHPFAQLAAVLEHRFKHSLSALSVIGLSPRRFEVGLLSNVPLKLLELSLSPDGTFIPPEVLQTVQTLTLDVTTFHPTKPFDYYFPSLTTLALIRIPEDEAHHWGNFISLHSSNLKCLRLSSNLQLSDPIFRSLILTATNLSTVALDKFDMTDLAPDTGDDVFASVQRLIVPDLAPANVDYFMKVFPALKEVSLTEVVSKYHAMKLRLGERGILVCTLGESG